uniref:(northern house mosquito) hypothetical protein n=1 Tax=Culex pipiens TaxID=7175 RepID=A0A8D8B6Y8_CULPI
MPGADSDRQTDGGDHAAGAEGDQQRSPQRDTADGGRQVLHHLRAGPAERQRKGQIPRARSGRYQLPSTADPPQGRERLRDAVENLRHSTEYYAWQWDATV